ncbi:hypothetical protein C7K25_14695 [Gulosibacter molinativorax]|uniref:Uncharacterized protein n=1 Tax=Gulosibacter molinativorax TaxID=256821 RepID=A0ABT7CBL2_9MICO|nr:hypothetical protein [Gulosibacter molinativorax]
MRHLELKDRLSTDSRIDRLKDRGPLEVPVLVVGRVIMRNLRDCSGAVPSACHFEFSEVFPACGTFLG